MIEIYGYRLCALHFIYPFGLSAHDVQANTQKSRGGLFVCLYKYGQYFAKIRCSAL